MTKVFKLVVSVISIIYIIGIPLYLIDRFINLPYFIVQERVALNGILGYKCYLFFVQAVNDFDLFPRFRSVFDEAGVVGTISFILLAGNKYKLNDWKYIVIFISGIVSLSFFFYLASLIVFMFHYVKKIKVVLMGLALISLIYFSIKDKEIFKRLIIDRFEINENKLAGDNRTSIEWDDHYKSFMNSNFKYTGHGMDSYDYLNFPGIASYQTFIYQYGIIGAFLILLYFALLLDWSVYKENIILFLTFILIFYQRPWIFDYYNPILFYSISCCFTQWKSKYFILSPLLKPNS